MSGNNIGMMDPAYFLGRKAIIDWLNTTFQFNLSKIEETASGAVCCQLLDAIYPGEVSVQRVRWDAKSPHEFIDNYKVIQSVFEKKGVDKYLGESWEGEELCDKNTRPFLGGGRTAFSQWQRTPQLKSLEERLNCRPMKTSVSPNTFFLCFHAP